MNIILWIIIAILFGVIIFCGIFIYYLTQISGVFTEALCEIINKRFKN